MLPLLPLRSKVQVASLIPERSSVSRAVIITFCEVELVLTELRFKDIPEISGAALSPEPIWVMCGVPNPVS